MSAISRSGSGNSLLDSLPPRQYKKVFSACTLVQLQSGQLFCEQQLRLTHVCFPLTAILAAVVAASGHPALGVMLIGSEGMLGATLILGVNTAPLTVLVQHPGSVLQISTRVFERLLRENPDLVPVLGRYLFSQYGQIARTIACTRFHEVESRLVRWLLLTHDRVDEDRFHLTHQFLADMLGVQRSAVTIAAGLLQERELIRYSRGEIVILSRKGLEASCCECYSLAAAFRLDSERPELPS